MHERAHLLLDEALPAAVVPAVGARGERDDGGHEHDADVGGGGAQDALDEGEVEREDGVSKGRYLLVIGGTESEMTYSRAGERLIIIDHTEVPSALRGRKVGERLVRQAVEDARLDNIKIIPLCPFAKAQFERHAEWHDVLKGS